MSDLPSNVDPMELYPIEMDADMVNEEGHYWSTLKDFEGLVKSHSVGAILNDLDDDIYFQLKGYFEDKLCP